MANDYLHGIGLRRYATENSFEKSEPTHQSACQNIFARPFARWLDRSLARSLGRSIARSLVRSIARSIARLIARSIAGSRARSLDRSLNRSLARSLARSLDRWLIISEVRISNHRHARELLGVSNLELLAHTISISRVSELRTHFRQNYDRIFLLFQGVPLATMKEFVCSAFGGPTLIIISLVSGVRGHFLGGYVFGSSMLDIRWGKFGNHFSSSSFEYISWAVLGAEVLISIPFSQNSRFVVSVGPCGQRHKK